MYFSALYWRPHNDPWPGLFQVFLESLAWVSIIREIWEHLPATSFVFTNNCSSHAASSWDPGAHRGVSSALLMLWVFFFWTEYILYLNMSIRIKDEFIWNQSGRIFLPFPILLYFCWPEPPCEPMSSAGHEHILESVVSELTIYFPHCISHTVTHGSVLTS